MQWNLINVYDILTLSIVDQRYGCCGQYLPLLGLGFGC